MVLRLLGRRAGGRRWRPQRWRRRARATSPVMQRARPRAPPGRGILAHPRRDHPSCPPWTAAGRRILHRPHARGDAAERRGLRPGDVVTEVNGVPIDSLATLIGLWPRLQTESAIHAVVMRNGQPVSLSVDLRSGCAGGPRRPRPAARRLHRRLRRPLRRRHRPRDRCPPASARGGDQPRRPGRRDRRRCDGPRDHAAAGRPARARRVGARGGERAADQDRPRARRALHRRLGRPQRDHRQPGAGAGGVGAGDAERVQLHPLAAEPLWLAAARQGLDAAVVSAPNVFPFSAYTAAASAARGEPARPVRRLPGRRRGRRRPHRGRGRLEAGDRRPVRAPAPIAARLARPPSRSRARGSTRGRSTTPPTPWTDWTPCSSPRTPIPPPAWPSRPSPPRDDPAAFGALAIALGGGEATIFFRLHELAADGSRILLWHSPPYLYLSSTPGRGEGGAAGLRWLRGQRRRRRLRRRRAGTAAVGRRRRHRRGAVRRERRPRRAAGRAPGRLRPGPARAGACSSPTCRTRTRRCIAGSAASTPAFPATTSRWRESSAPTWTGSSPSWTRTWAAWRRRPAADAVVVIATDHGMTSASRTFRPNAALREAGLLATTPPAASISRGRARCTSPGTPATCA